MINRIFLDAELNLNNLNNVNNKKNLVFSSDFESNTPAYLNFDQKINLLYYKR